MALLLASALPLLAEEPQTINPESSTTTTTTTSSSSSIPTEQDENDEVIISASEAIHQDSFQLPSLKEVDVLTEEHVYAIPTDNDAEESGTAKNSDGGTTASLDSSSDDDEASVSVSTASVDSFS